MAKTNILEQIKSHLRQVAKDIQDGKNPQLELARNSSCVVMAGNGILQAAAKESHNKPLKIRFAVGHVSESRIFVIYLRVMSLVVEALENDKIITKRDIFYNDVGLFKTQILVNKVIERLAISLGVSRYQLNIVASPKGQAYGEFDLFDCNDKVYEFRQDNLEYLIPVGPYFRYVKLLKKVSYVLIVEKEGLRKFLTDAILVTGKGSPDIATRQFLHVLADNHHYIPVYGLFDSDPYGIQIFTSYKIGSEAQVEQNIHLAVPRAQYLGVSILDHDFGWMNLTSRDVDKSFGLLNKGWMIASHMSEIRRELQIGLFLNKKAEMNTVGNDYPGAGRLARYIESKIEMK